MTNDLEAWLAYDKPSPGIYIVKSCPGSQAHEIYWIDFLDTYVSTF